MIIHRYLLSGWYCMSANAVPRPLGRVLNRRLISVMNGSSWRNVKRFPPKFVDTNSDSSSGDISCLRSINSKLGFIFPRDSGCHTFRDKPLVALGFSLKMVRRFRQGISAAKVKGSTDMGYRCSITDSHLAVLERLADRSRSKSQIKKATRSRVAQGSVGEVYLSYLWLTD